MSISGLLSFAQWHPAWKVILVILSGMADLNQNIDMTKLKVSYKWSGVWQEKGLASFIGVAMA
jgi:hypothetical protein